MFRFRKVYADLVTDDGTVAIAYLAWTDVGALSGAGSGLELYRPDGSREVIRGLSPAPLDPPDGTRRPPEIRLELPDDSLRLEYGASGPPWTPAASPLPGLSWSVLVPGAPVTATWREQDRQLVGAGYIDWVELTRPTRRLGLRRIDWARVHAGHSTLVYTGIIARGGRSWHRAALWCERCQNAPRVRGDVRLREPSRGPGQLECRGEEAFEFVLQPQRVLHDGPVIDRARSPGLLERSAFRLVTGRSYETRWVSRAYRPGCADPAGWAVHEVVRFGR